MPSASASRLLLRADAGAVGHGHVMRSLALAEAWTASGGLATLASVDIPDRLRARVETAGVEVVALTKGGAGFLDVAAALAPAWVSLDGYHLGSDLQQAVVDAGHRLLVVDDHGAAGRYVAHVVVDQNLGARADAYCDRPAGSELLLGPRYALIRRAFLAHKPRHGRPIADCVQRVLVTLGGSPPADAAATVVAAVREVAAAGPPIEVLVARGDVDDMAALMAAADVAVAAGGSTTWELCLLGVPMILVTLASNQEPVAAALAERGAAVDLGRIDRVRPADLARAVAELVDDESRRAAMAEAGRATVDGLGACRVVNRLRTHLLVLRPARPGDRELLWQWANDPAVRTRSFRPEPIPWDDHVGWFGRRLADPRCHLYLAEDEGGRPVGQIRFGCDGDDAEVGVSVAADERGRGLGGALIRAGVARLFADASVRRVHAWVRTDNPASARAFAGAGFERVGDGVRHGVEASHLVLARER